MQVSKSDVQISPLGRVRHHPHACTSRETIWHNHGQVGCYADLLVCAETHRGCSGSFRGLVLSDVQHRDRREGKRVRRFLDARVGLSKLLQPDLRDEAHLTECFAPREP